MKCKECGTEVIGSEVFCSQCGAPLRVTADYDYIQAEIGEKVDQLLSNGDDEDTSSDASLMPEADNDASGQEPPDLNIIGDMIGDKPIIDIPEKPKAEKKANDGLAITRTIDLSDSIYREITEEDEYEDEYEYEDDPEDEALLSAREEYMESRDARKKRADLRAKRRKRNIIVIIVAIAAVVAVAVGVLLWLNGRAKKEAELNDVISCSVENGATYTAPLEITLTSEKGYRIAYTLDGTEPSLSSSSKYKDPIIFNNTDINGDSMQVTLNAVSYTDKASLKAGNVSITFTVEKSAVAPPYFSHESGDYYQQEYITIAGAEGTTIHYTYDGSTPTANSPVYYEPIEMLRGNNILSAIAIDESGAESEVASSVYNLIMDPNISYDEALGNVVNVLMQEGLIRNTTRQANDAYDAGDGGTRRVLNNGTAMIGNINYYVLQVDYINNGNSVQATTYYGVNDMTGEVVRLAKSGMNFVYG